MSEISVDTLQSRIENVIQIHREAKDVTNAEVVGVLEIIKLDIWEDMEKIDEDGI